MRVLQNASVVTYVLQAVHVHVVLDTKCAVGVYDCVYADLMTVSIYNMIVLLVYIIMLRILMQNT